MSKLIALVATKVMVEGVATIIQPGEPLPELSKHDARELLSTNMAEDPIDKAEAADDAAFAAKVAQADFNKARQRVKDELASQTQGTADTSTGADAQLQAKAEQEAQEKAAANAKATQPPATKAGGKK